MEWSTFCSKVWLKSMRCHQEAYVHPCALEADSLFSPLPVLQARHWEIKADGWGRSPRGETVREGKRLGRKGSKKQIQSFLSFAEAHFDLG